MWSLETSDNYLPVVPHIPAELRSGRSILDGYTRGWGLKYGELKTKILADPLYVRSLEFAAGRTIQEEARRMNIFLILKYYLSKLPAGNIIEFGSFRGGSCIFMAAVCAALGLETIVYGLDTFGGMPATDKTIDAHNQGNFERTDLAELRDYVRRLGLKNLEFVKGKFDETAPGLLPRIAPITLAHIDCDIRSSVAYSYEAVRPYMIDGGYIVFDDAQSSSCLGATEAVEDLLIRRDGMNAEQVDPHYVFRARISQGSQVNCNNKAHLAPTVDEDVFALMWQLAESRNQLKRLEERVQELSALSNRSTLWKRAVGLVALTTVDWAVGFVVFAAEMAARLLRMVHQRRAPLSAPADTSHCSIIVLSWEGKDLLAQSLPPLLKAVRRQGGEHEIIVLDNGSTDGTSEYVREHFPEVRLVRSERNLFFSGGNNLGVHAAKNDIVILLNNDMFVHEEFLDPLLKGFEDPDVFAVASQVFFANPNQRREETGKTRASFNGCDLDWAHDAILPSDEEQKYVPVFWGHGGAVALDRQKYLWLGGLDDKVFGPLYVEDSDLSYRAWKVGWRCQLAVDSHVVHKHRGTVNSRVGPRLVSQLVRRNTYLFVWKNFGDLGKLMRHFLFAPVRAMERAAVPGVGIKLEVKSFLGAIKRLPMAIRGKLRLAASVVRTDEEILRLVGVPPTHIARESETASRDVVAPSS